MFGRDKQGGVVRVDSLTRAARATIETALIRHYRAGVRAGAEEATVKKAAAAANFLSGQAPNPTLAGVDLPQVQAEAREWIRRNVEMRELVVQTLRLTVAARSAGTRSDTVSDGSLSILSEFGSDSTATPDPLAYEASVRRAIATLPHNTQVQLMRLTKAED